MQASHMRAWWVVALHTHSQHTLHTYTHSCHTIITNRHALSTSHHTQDMPKTRAAAAAAGGPSGSAGPTGGGAGGGRAAATHGEVPQRRPRRKAQHSRKPKGWVEELKNHMTRSGISGLMRPRNARGLLLHPLNTVSLYEHSTAFHASHTKVLSRIGETLPLKMRVVPTKIQQAWNQVRDHIMHETGLMRGEVHNAMLVMLPLTFPSNTEFTQAHYGSSPCMVMSGAKRVAKAKGGVYTHDDYGYVHIYLGGGKKLPAHRFVLYAIYGLPHQEQVLKCTSQADLNKIMKGMHAIHLCNNKKCCNLKHLRWGTAQQNNSPHKSVTHDENGKAKEVVDRTWKAHHDAMYNEATSIHGVDACEPSVHNLSHLDL